MMKAFGFGASTNFVYTGGSKMAAVSLKMLLKNKQSISNAPGLLKEWTNSRDFPTPKQSRFPYWMKVREEVKND